MERDREERSDECEDLRDREEKKSGHCRFKPSRFSPSQARPWGTARMVGRMSPWKRWKRWDRQRHDPTLCFPESKSPLPVPMVCLYGMGPSLRYPGNPNPDPDRPCLDNCRRQGPTEATEQPSPPSCSESEFGKIWSWEINRQDDAGGCYVSIRLEFSDAHVVCVDPARGHHDVKYQVGTTPCDVPCLPQLWYLHLSMVASPDGRYYSNY
jgi:hypothetical protein